MKRLEWTFVDNAGNIPQYIARDEEFAYDASLIVDGRYTETGEIDRSQRGWYVFCKTQQGISIDQILPCAPPPPIVFSDNFEHMKEAIEAWRKEIGRELIKRSESEVERLAQLRQVWGKEE